MSGPPGSARIVSLLGSGPPTGVASNDPSAKPSQTLTLNGLVTAWVLRKDDEDVFRFSLDKYPYTGIDEGKVTVYGKDQKGQDLQWRVTYREAQKAYTIEPEGNRGKGWTVDGDSHFAQIAIKDLIATKSDPPQYSTGQLFKVVRNE